ncbi:hypothetical protein K439DRAFT_413218 [Ramaria rubella]|nr:hypothetical protein K439DRAFT_413218 [Ramaria rubella]
MTISVRWAGDGKGARHWVDLPIPHLMNVSARSFQIQGEYFRCGVTDAIRGLGADGGGVREPVRRAREFQLHQQRGRAQLASYPPTKILFTPSESLIKTTMFRVRSPLARLRSGGIQTTTTQHATIFLDSTALSASTRARRACGPTPTRVATRAMDTQ